MKPRNLTIAISRYAIAACMLLAGGSAIAAVANTPHNLGSAGPGPNTFSGTAEICVFCHTPHGGDTSAAVPLWNRTVPTGPYQTYSTLNTSSLSGAELAVGSVSLACLSCHDGSQAMDVVLNEPGSGTGFGVATDAFSTGDWGLGNDRPTGIALIGTDLRNDHPIGIQYGGGGITTTVLAPLDPDFKPVLTDTINTNDVWWVETGGNTTREKTDLQLYTRAGEPYVECASCHDPHESVNATFLRVSNASSAVCLACHTK